VTITELEAEPDGLEAGVVKVTKVEAPEVLVGVTATMDEPLPIEVEAETEEEPETRVEVTIAVKLTPTVLLEVLEGVEVGGW
jgi:hypothetical protein